MSGGKKIISVLLALAMVGQMGLTLGMAAPANYGCGSPDHGLTGKDAKQACTNGTLGMHWATINAGTPTVNIQSQTTYFYPKIDTEISLNPGLTDVIVLEDPMPAAITLRGFSEEDKIVVPNSPNSGVNMGKWSSETVENNIKHTRIVTVGGCTITIENISYGTAEDPSSGDSSSEAPVTEDPPSEAPLPDITIIQTPANPLGLSYNKETRKLSATGGYTGKYTYLRETAGEDKLTHTILISDGGSECTVTPPDDGSKYCYFVVENDTGRTARIPGNIAEYMTAGCLMVPAVSITESTGLANSTVEPGSSTKTYKLTPVVSYSGTCDRHGDSSGHNFAGYTTTWKVREEVPGVSVAGDGTGTGTVTIVGRELEPGEKEVTIDVTVAKDGVSKTATAAISFKVKGADSIDDTGSTGSTGNPDSTGSEDDAGWNGTLTIKTGDAPAMVKIDKDSADTITYTYSTDIPPEELETNYSLEWELTPTAGYIRVEPEDSATAKVIISKAGLPKEGIPEPGKRFTLTVTAVSPAGLRAVQAKAIAAFAVVPTSGTQGPTANTTITVVADAVPDQETKDPDEPGKTPGSGQEPEVEIKGGDNNPTPNAITITSSSAAKVSYDYDAVPSGGKEEDYKFEWTLTNQRYPNKLPDYISLSFKNSRATVTVTKAKLPDEGVNTTFDLTVTLTPVSPEGQPVGLTVAPAPLAATTAAGTLTKTFAIKVYAARKASSSTSSSSSSSSSDSTDIANRDQWLKVERDIQRAQKGSTVKVSLKDNIHMPFYIYDALEGQDVSLQMKISGGYTWTVNGRSVRQLPKNQVWVSLGVKTYSNSKMTSLCRESKIKGFQLENKNGESFFGDLRLTMNLGSGYAKKTVYLYSYDEAKNKLTYNSSAKVADNGDVDFVFTRSLGAYAVTSKALYGESAVTTGGGVLEGGNKPTAIYPPVASTAPYQPPAPESPSSGSSSQSEPASSSSQEPSSAPDTTPVDTIVQPEPEPEDPSIPVMVPLLILAIAGVIAATVVVINNSRAKDGFDF